MFETPRASKRRKLSETVEDEPVDVETTDTRSIRRSSRSKRPSLRAAPSPTVPVKRPTTNRRPAKDSNTAPAGSPPESKTTSAQKRTASSRGVKRGTTNGIVDKEEELEVTPLRASRRSIRTSGAQDHAQDVVESAVPKRTPQARRGRRKADTLNDIQQPSAAAPLEDEGVSTTPHLLDETRNVEDDDELATAERVVETATPKAKRGRKPKAAKSAQNDHQPEPIDVDAADVDGALDAKGVQDNLDNLIDTIASNAVEPLPPTPVATAPDIAPQASAPFETLRNIALSKLTSHRPIPLQNLSVERSKVKSLVHATVAAAEGNSLLLLGPHGAGKSAIVDDVLRELDADPALKGTFHAIKLDGMIQTDDKLALREIWRQLGREIFSRRAEYDGDSDDDNDATPEGFTDGEGGRSYADTLATLLSVLSHPEELAAQAAARSGHSLSASDGPATTAHSIVFVLSSFEAFAARPRQTLLYNLFDVAQARKAPIAVLGLTTRVDAPDLLEKRVKSRFSHRSVLVRPARSLPAFAETVSAALRVETAELSFADRAEATDADVREWNAAAADLLAQPAVQATLARVYHTSKSVPEALAALLVPTHMLQPLPDDETQTDSQAQTVDPLREKQSQTQLLSSTLLPPPSTPLHLLPSLPTLSLALLIAACRLPILHSTATSAITAPAKADDAGHSVPVNFALAYGEYARLAAAARAGAAGAVHAGGGGAVARVWSRAVARGAWEGLVRRGLVVPDSGAAVAVGETETVRVEVALEEIEGAVGGGMDAALARWCRSL